MELFLKTGDRFLSKIDRTDPVKYIYIYVYILGNKKSKQNRKTIFFNN